MCYFVEGYCHSHSVLKETGKLKNYFGVAARNKRFYKKCYQKKKNC